MAEPALADLVLEFSQTLGAGNLTLTRAGGYARGSEAFGLGDQGALNPIMFIVNKDATAQEWELSPCYWSDANTMVRGTPQLSSNANAAVAFTAGKKHISNDLPASLQKSRATTGDLKPTHKLTADPGWIMWSDGTIGGAGSGASIRVNADTRSLFDLYWAYPEASCPLTTSTGAATTRAAQGTTAAAFAAGCRMALPRAAGRALSVAGSGSGLTARTPGAWAGAETETPTLAKTALHGHTGSIPQEYGQAAQSPDPTQRGVFNFVNGVVPTGGGSPLDIMGPSAFVNVMIKL